MLGMPTSAHAGLLDDERFLLAYNFSPASTVSVVDLEAGSFVGEIELAGCALIYPLGPRRFTTPVRRRGPARGDARRRRAARTSRKVNAKLFDPTSTR